MYHVSHVSVFTELLLMFLLILSLLALISFANGRIMSVADASMGMQADKALPKNAIYVPLYKQQTDYSCGPSSCLSLLRYYDMNKYKSTTEQQLYPKMGTTSANGTRAVKMAEYFVEYTDYFATYLQGGAVGPSGLEKSIDDKFPPIVEIQAWKSNRSIPYDNSWGDGHYNVMIGYDADTYYFMDPWIGKYAWIGKKEFMTRWHDTDSGENNAKFYRQVILIQGDYGVPVKPDSYMATYEA